MTAKLELHLKLDGFQVENRWHDGNGVVVTRWNLVEDSSGNNHTSALFGNADIVADDAFGACADFDGDVKSYIKVPSAQPLKIAGDVTLDVSARQAWHNERPLSLTMAEFGLLDAFVRHAGQVLSRDRLAEHVLGRRLAAFDRSIDVHVSNLRKKLGDPAGGREHIRAVRGEGYVFVRVDPERR